MTRFDIVGDFTLVSRTPERICKVSTYDDITFAGRTTWIPCWEPDERTIKELWIMAAKTTREPIDSHDQGPVKAGEKAGPVTDKTQEELDKAPVLEQHEYIVDGNTVVKTHETAEGEPFDQEQYEKDRAAGLGASGSTVPLDDVAIGLQPGGAGNPAAASHQSGAMDVPDAEGDPDSIAAWNARHEAEQAYQGGEAKEAREAGQERQAAETAQRQAQQPSVPANETPEQRKQREQREADRARDANKKN